MNNMAQFFTLISLYGTNRYNQSLSCEPVRESLCNALQCSGPMGNATMELLACQDPIGMNFAVDYPVLHTRANATFYSDYKFNMSSGYLDITLDHLGKDVIGYGVSSETISPPLHSLTKLKRMQQRP